MENAWLYFSEGNHKEAEKVYKFLIPDFKDNYILQFRLGELYFVQDKITEALEAMDKSETLSAKEQNVNYENMYRNKVKLANIYWMLGKTYVHLSFEKMRKAEQIYESHKELFDENVYASLINNLCWYSLDNYLIGNEKISGLLDIVKTYYDKLEKCLEIDESSNIYDTLAWFCYQFYLKEKDVKYLAKARGYCDKVIENEKNNDATFLFTSYKIHIDHIQEITTVRNNP